jgi:hypothetical protein
MGVGGWLFGAVLASGGLIPYQYLPCAVFDYFEQPTSSATSQLDALLELSGPDHEAPADTYEQRDVFSRW